MRNLESCVVTAILATLVALTGCVSANPRPTVSSSSPTLEKNIPIEPEFVVVEWAGTTKLYTGRVTERREGLVGVLYPDGSREWAEPERVRPLGLSEGDRVRVRWMEGGPEWSGQIVGLRSDLVRVHFENDSVTWVSLDMIARVQGAAAPPPRVCASAQPDAQAAVDSSRILVGLLGIALYDETTPYAVEFLEVASARVSVRWLSDGTQSWISQEQVTTVFDHAPTQLTPGLRVRYVGARGLAVGVISEVRDGFVRIAGSPTSRGEWVEGREVVENLDADQSNQGSPTTQAVVL